MDVKGSSKILVNAFNITLCINPKVQHSLLWKPHILHQ